MRFPIPEATHDRPSPCVRDQKSAVPVPNAFRVLASLKYVRFLSRGPLTLTLVSSAPVCSPRLLPQAIPSLPLAVVRVCGPASDLALVSLYGPCCHHTRYSYAFRSTRATWVWGSLSGVLGFCAADSARPTWSAGSLERAYWAV